MCRTQNLLNPQPDTYVHTINLDSLNKTTLLFKKNKLLASQWLTIQPSLPRYLNMSDKQFIEHVVLFKVKQDVDSNKVNAMVNALNSLTSLNLTFHLTEGPLLKSTSSSSSLTFTHMLHSHYRTFEDLQTYAVHPEHVRVVNANKPVMDDIMAVDWISNGLSGFIDAGKVMRVSFVKLKDENEKSRVLDVIRGTVNDELISVGENFLLDRAKGYSIASVAVFSGVEELEKMNENVELAKVK